MYVPILVVAFSQKITFKSAVWQDTLSHCSNECAAVNVPKVEGRMLAYLFFSPLEGTNL
jgi:hypothetical protein